MGVTGAAMIDTLKLRSPELPAEVFDRISVQLNTRMKFENSSGLVLSEFTNGMLEGSFDHRVSVNMMDREIRTISAIRTRTGKAEIVEVPCRKVEIEGSVHKAIEGYNVAGGPEDVLASCRWFVNMVADGLAVELPPAGDWELLRIDNSECFDLGSFDACQEFLSALRLAKFPRRKIQNYGNETVGFYGTTTAWKAYHKGPEFACHDRLRLRKIWPADKVQSIQDFANGIIRVETSIKSKKLKTDFGGTALVKSVTMDYVVRVHDLETLRVIRESEQDMNTVRHTRDVQRRLFDVYGHVAGTHLFGTWMQLSGCGEEHVRENLSRTAFYRHRKLLQDAGVSWISTDVHIVKTAIPEGFSLRRSDPRRLTGESDAVRIALMPYRAVTAA